MSSTRTRTVSANGGAARADAALVSPCHNQVAVAKHRQGVAHLQQIFGSGGGHDHRRTEAIQFAQDFNLFQTSEAVQAAQGIVQEQHVGLVNERTRQGESTPLARRKRAHVTPAAFFETHYLQKGVDGDLAHLLAEATGAAHELEVLLGAEAVVQHRLFGDIPDPVAYGARTTQRVVPMDRYPSGCGAIQAGYQSQEHGLARAVCAGDAERHARRNGERNILQDSSSAKTADDVLDNHGRLARRTRHRQPLVLERPLLQRHSRLASLAAEEGIRLGIHLCAGASSQGSVG